MAEIIEGNPAIYPIDFPIPDASSPPDGAAVNPAFEALAHRTAWLRAQLVSQLNFRPVTIADEAFHAFFAPKSNSWLLCYLNETVLETADMGGKVSASVVSGAGAGENSIHGNADPNGNWVIATTSRYVFQRTQSTQVVTKVDVYGSDMTWADSKVVYDPVRAKWLWWGVNDDGSFKAMKSSSDRLSWSFGTLAPYCNEVNFAKPMVVNPVTGRILFVGLDYLDLSKLCVQRTDNTGASWATTVITLASWIPDTVSLSCNKRDGSWVLAASSVSDSTCRVWRSIDDGVTWTQVSALTTAFITSIEAYGDLWVACAKGLHADANTYDVLCSTDAGATWVRGGIQARFAVRIYLGAEGFVLPAEDRVFFGLRNHAIALGVVT